MKIQLNLFTNCTANNTFETIKRTYSSFCDCFGKLPAIVYMDVNPMRRNAEKYSDNLQKHFGNVIITNSLSQGYVSAIKNSNADYLFNLEHDWIFNKDLIKHSLDEICQIMNMMGLYHFRFNKRANISAGWEADIKLKEWEFYPVQFRNPFYYCETKILSNNPHIINRCYYLENFMDRIKIMPGSKGIEKELSTGDLTGAIYGGKNFEPTVKHLDGRRSK